MSPLNLITNFFSSYDTVQVSKLSEPHLCTPSQTEDASLQQTVVHAATEDTSRSQTVVESANAISKRLPLLLQPTLLVPQCHPSEPVYLVVGRNAEHYPCISFFPHDGRGTGAAMGLAFYQEGMAMKEESIEFGLPPSLRGRVSLPYILRWPGYAHISYQCNVFLIDPFTHEHVTHGRLAQQFAEIFSTFIENYGDYFDGPGIQLGPRWVTFHGLRLHQVYFRDTRADVEISYTTQR
ncbi:hypothetical protein R3P38DRAFT_2953368 [Favolaschia claudopus]|uniref:Uncharacterized protein n=1 Tax=Favolaschia claudopus TaxID=2862362 RepID=A0AAW0BFJ9_9AGAR